jgi:hypothetical protein
MHFNILNKQGAVIGEALVLPRYSYYIINLSNDYLAKQIDTDELFLTYMLESI